MPTYMTATVELEVSGNVTIDQVTNIIKSAFTVGLEVSPYEELISYDNVTIEVGTINIKASKINYKKRK